MERGGGPHDAFAELYEASMLASFRPEDLRSAAQATLPAHVSFHSTFPIPFLTVLKTPGRGLTLRQKERARRLLAGLDYSQRKDYTQLRYAFRLGGLKSPAITEPG